MIEWNDENTLKYGTRAVCIAQQLAKEAEQCLAKINSDPSCEAYESKHLNYIKQQITVLEKVHFLICAANEFYHIKKEEG